MLSYFPKRQDNSFIRFQQYQLSQALYGQNKCFYNVGMKITDDLQH